LPKRNSCGILKLSRALILLLLVFSLSGCTIKFFYEQIDWLVPWQLDRHLDLSSSQKKTLKQAVSSQLRWHRQAQVSAYIVTLKEWQRFFSAPFSRNEFDVLNQKTQNHLVKLTEHLLPDVWRFLHSLSPKQRLSVYQLIQEYNQDYYDEYLADDVDLASVHLKESKEAVRFWLGSVSDEQEKRLLVMLAKYQGSEAETMRNRERWLFRLKEILESEAGQDEKFLKLEQLFLSPRDDWSEEYQKRFDYNAELSAQMMEEILKLATPRQRDHLIRHFKSWQEQFQVISKKGDS